MMPDVYRGVEKRHHPRTIFGLRGRPRLKIGLQEFEVIDISEKGVQFVNDKVVGIKGWVNGTLVFSDSRSIDIDGIIVRQDGGNLGLHLISPLEPNAS
ncbi:PilZ domain-containing protein [Desulfosarcina sp.]|uniref:PilZ domain-containing protein n=1 Tax=Desulfosarcina sp. TaxID=2027861 RepID=UPI003970BF87